MAKTKPVVMDRVSRQNAYRRVLAKGQIDVAVAIANQSRSVSAEVLVSSGVPTLSAQMDAYHQALVLQLNHIPTQNSAGTVLSVHSKNVTTVILSVEMAVARCASARHSVPMTTEEVIR